MAASIGVMPSSTFKYIFRDYDSVIYNSSQKIGNMA
jgi:hypothetical protein